MLAVKVGDGAVKTNRMVMHGRTRTRQNMGGRIVLKCTGRERTLMEEPL